MGSDREPRQHITETGGDGETIRRLRGEVKAMSADLIWVGRRCERAEAKLARCREALEIITCNPDPISVAADIARQALTEVTDDED